MYQYDKIDEVPDDIIEKLALALLGSYGATGEDDLKQAISRQLGFKRTGKNIVARLDRTIENLKRTGEGHPVRCGNAQVERRQGQEAGLMSGPDRFSNRVVDASQRGFVVSFIEAGGRRRSRR